MITEIMIIIRLVSAFACGALVGLERTTRMKDAGVRTHSLIALAAAAMMLLSRYAFANQGVNFDAARIAAGIVSGISFVGAGVIYRDGSSLRGLSTASGIWATAAIGMAMGSGMYFLGGALTFMVVTVQVVLHKILIGNDSYMDNELVITYTQDGRTQVETLLKELEEQHLLRIGHVSTKKDEQGVILYCCTMQYRVRYNVRQLQDRLNELPAVMSTDFQ